MVQMQTLKEREEEYPFLEKNNMIGDVYVDDLDVGLLNNEFMQIEDFYFSIINGNKDMEKKSLDTWILMEALNEFKTK